MADSQELILTKEDYENLVRLVSGVYNETSELLEDELNRAKVVEPELLPSDVVTMNATVEFEDEAGVKTLVQLVYPQDLKVQEVGKNKISVLAPIGAALIGLKVGQTISWPLPNGKTKNLKVIRVEQQI